MKTALSITIICVLAAIAGCNGGNATENQPGTGAETNVYEQTLKEAEDINKNCNLGFEYMSFSQIPEDDATEYGPDHPEARGTNDGYVTGYYFNYPYDSADRRLTQIYIEGGDYDFYGIKVGDDISKVKPIMNEKGYSQTDNLYVFDGTATETYIKHHVYIVLETKKDTSVIVAILVSMDDPNEPEPDEIY